MSHFEHKNQRILAVDDHPVTLRVIETALTKAGYDVQLAQSGNEALQSIRKFGLPHLALIDLHMPVMDGFMLCKKLLSFSDLPIIMVTADDDEQTMIKGIQQFAEDYVVKPFSPAVLVARVERVLRRVGDYSYTLDPMVTVDERLQVDFAGRSAHVAGETVSLTPTETKLLYILMRHAGRTLTSDYLMQRVWPSGSGSEQTLHTHIYRLRSKIEVNAKEPKYVLSEWGTGYMMPRISG